jgi:cytochrome c-type biogenesis protein CcmH/NrfG
MNSLFKRLLDSENGIYALNGIAAVCGLIIVLLILSSNVSARRTKIAQIPKNTRILLSAVESARESLRQNPDDVHLNTQMANSLFDTQKYHAAIPFYKRVLQQTPNNIEVCVDLGVSYFNIEMLDSASIAMHRALEIDPTHVKALFNLGVIYYNTGDLKQAKNHWEVLVELHPEARESEIAQELITKIES